MSGDISQPEPRPAEILREYGPFPGAPHVHGLTFDGTLVWFAAGDHLQSFDPQTGEPGRSLAVPADAGSAFDGRHFFQLAGGRIQKINPQTGQVLAVLPAPGDGPHSGLAWAEGTLWVAEYKNRKIHQVDANTGRLLRTIESSRFVTGITWVDGDLWHATWENEESEIRRLDAESGEVLERLRLPAGTFVSGLESDGKEVFFCGGGKSGKVRTVRRPKRK